MSANSTEITEKSLLEAVEASDVDRALEICVKMMSQGIDPWKIHLLLFPAVQRVQNPPFINPHLPKVYGIYRELVPYLSEGKTGDFLSLEIREYARRPKMEKIPRGDRLPPPVGFKDIEAAIQANDPEKAAALMATFLKQESGVEFARRLLLLGSGYLNSSLGHSVSCTAFILSEMLERTDLDSWPALSALALLTLRTFSCTLSIEVIHMTTIKATEARANLYKLLDQAGESHEPIQITGKRSNAILISEEDWRSIQETLYLLSIPGMRESIRKGLKTPVKKCSEKPGW